MVPEEEFDLLYDQLDRLFDEPQFDREQLPDPRDEGVWWYRHDSDEWVWFPWGSGPSLLGGYWRDEHTSVRNSSTMRAKTLRAIGEGAEARQEYYGKASTYQIINSGIDPWKVSCATRFLRRAGLT